MRLYELDLAIGQQVSLKIVGLDYKAHAFDAQLIGYQKGESVLLTLLSKPGQVLLHKGLKATVRGQLDNGFFSFESEIEDVVESPFLYVHLEFPPTVEYRQLRDHARIPVDTPVAVSALTGLGMKTGTINGYMLDVSRGGARLVLEKELTAMVTRITIGVMLAAPGLERDLTLTATVRRTAPVSSDHPKCGFAYGVAFVELPAMESLFLQTFCQQEQLRGNIVPVKE